VRSFHLERSGAGVEGLALCEEPVPRPGPGEVLIRVRANSLSFREQMVLRGDYVLPVQPNIVPLSDGAGEVVELGEGVASLRRGDRVAANVFPFWLEGRFRVEAVPQLGSMLDGLLRDFAVLPAEALVQIPRHLSFAEASTLPCVGVTAWNAVTGGRPLRAGETVLTLGTGGVSLFALQFAKYLGARVIATTGDEQKERKLSELGADEVINYRAESEWNDRVRDLTGGRGVDLVVDVAGQLEKSLKSVALGGEVAFVGFLAEDGVEPVDQSVLFYSGATLRTIAIGSRAQFVEMNEAIELAGLRPVIARAFPFEQIAEAFRYYQEKRPFGKVVITNDSARTDGEDADMRERPAVRGAEPDESIRKWRGPESNWRHHFRGTSRSSRTCQDPWFAGG
jgi:NADPH:quinone reductase-like Zn-dependent oxidoreductase